MTSENPLTDASKKVPFPQHTKTSEGLEKWQIISASTMLILFLVFAFILAMYGHTSAAITAFAAPIVAYISHLFLKRWTWRN